MISGLDPSGYAINVAKEEHNRTNLTNVRFEQKYATNCPVEWENTFDWIILWDVLHDLPNPREVLEVLWKVLKRDGIISIQDPAVHSKHIENVGDSSTACVLSIGMFWCLPNTMVNGSREALGVGWGMENKREYLIDFGWRELTDDNLDGIMTFEKGDRSKHSN